MAVKKHPTMGGAYQISWWVPDASKKEGRRREYETYVGSREDAQRRDTELRKRHCEDAGPKTNPRLEEIFADFLDWIDVNRSKGYYKSFVWALEKIRPHFGKYPVSRITRVMIDDFKKKHRSTPAHCNQCLDYLKVIISWMHERDMAMPLPFKVEKLKHFRSLPEPPDPGEFQKFMDQVELNFRESGTSVKDRAIKKALILTIYETGLRFVEAVNIQWQNLHDDGRCYLGRTKTGVARYTIISQDVLALLRPYRTNDEGEAKEGPVFINSVTGEPFTTIYNLIHDNAKRAGVKIRGSHTLRHAMGTDSLEAGADLRSVQEILGHTTIKSTEKYTHVSTKRKREIIDATRRYRAGQNAGDKKKDK